MRYQNPRNLWEAVALLADLQHERAQAMRENDRRRLAWLARRRLQAWGYVRLCAERLAQRGEAPDDFPDHLRRYLGVSPGDDDWWRACGACVEVGPTLPGSSRESRLAA